MFSKLPILGSGCIQPALAGSEHLCLLTSSYSGQSGETNRLSMPEYHIDCSRVAQHAMVLGSSSHVKPDPAVHAQPGQSADSALQLDSTQECVKPKSPCLAPTPSAIKFIV